MGIDLQIDNIDATSELGNIWLSFQYIRDVFGVSDKSDIGDLRMADIGTNKETLPFLMKSDFDVKIESMT